MKFYEICVEWCEFKANFVKRSSMSSYMLLIENHLIPFFGEMESISEKNLQNFVLAKINGTLAKKTTKDCLIVLKMILKYGIKNKLWENMPLFDEIQFPPEQQKKKIEVLSVSDYKKAVSYIKDNFSFRNLGILISLSTGMRIGEICGLKWKDVDIKNGVINVRRTVQRIYVSSATGQKSTELIIDNPKTSSSNRQIPLSKDLNILFKKFYDVVNKEFYVVTNSEKPTEPRTYRAYFQEIFKTVGLPKIKFHGLRHSFATQCIAAKIDVKTVSALLGHSNVTTTFNLYVHPDNIQKKAAIDKLFKSIK